MSEWERLLCRSCRWINMQTVAQFYPKCAISQTMKSQEKSMLQDNAKQDQTISKNLFLIKSTFRCSLWKGNGDTANKVWLVSGFEQSVWLLSGLFLALFGFLLKFSSCNPDCSWSGPWGYEWFMVYPTTSTRSLIAWFDGHLLFRRKIIFTIQKNLTWLNGHNVQDRLSTISIRCIKSDKLRQTNFNEFVDDFVMKMAKAKPF